MIRNDGFLEEGIRKCGDAKGLIAVFEERLKQKLEKILKGYEKKLDAFGKLSNYESEIKKKYVDAYAKCEYGKKSAYIYIGIEWNDIAIPLLFAGLEDKNEKSIDIYENYTQQNDIKVKNEENDEYLYISYDKEFDMNEVEKDFGRLLRTLNGEAKAATKMK